MVNAAVTTAREAERALAIGYAPADRRAGLAALLGYDARLGDVLRTTREPLVGQMRLAWWREAVAALDGGRAPAEPVLVALAEQVVPLEVGGGSLAAVCDGWEHLLADPLDTATLTALASKRGGALFMLAARLLGGAGEGVAPLGEGWALADLAGHLSDGAVAAEARRLAAERLAGLGSRRLPLRLRALGALALLARDDLRGGVPGSPRRVARLAIHRLTGR